MTNEEYVEIRIAQRERSIAALKKLGEQARKAGMHELADAAEAEVPKPGLGDMVAAATTALGIEPCDDCNKRKAAMNQIDLGKPALEIARGLLRAIFNPDEAIRSSS